MGTIVSTSMTRLFDVCCSLVPLTLLAFTFLLLTLAPLSPSSLPASPLPPSSLSPRGDGQAGSKAVVGAEGVDGDAAAHVNALDHIEHQVLVQAIQGDLINWEAEGADMRWGGGQT